MTDTVLIKSASPSRDEARRISDRLLRERLASAVQIREIESLYWWRDERFDAQEWEITIFTRASLFKKIEFVIREEHSYELPECVAISIENISPQYSAWIYKYTEEN
jgi:periplasmic divalent cation tolerance protein